MCSDQQISKAPLQEYVQMFPHICNRKPGRMGLGEGLEAV